MKQILQAKVNLLIEKNRLEIEEKEKEKKSKPPPRNLKAVELSVLLPHLKTNTRWKIYFSF